MRSKIFKMMIGLPVFGIIGLAGCGGGGGGGSGGGTGTVGISYSGVTTQASLTTANANKIFSLVWDGAPLSGSISTSAPKVAKTVPYDNSKGGGIVPLVKRMVKKTVANAALFSGNSKNVKRMIPVNETQNGTISGKLSLTGSVDDTTGTGSITESFSNYNDGDGYTYNGNVLVQISGIDVTSGVMTDTTMSFSLWTIKSISSDFSISGSIRLQGSVQNNSEIVTINLDGRENISKETFRYANFVETTVYDNILFPRSASGSFSGQVYLEKLGYVMISTVSPCIYSDPNANPSSGGPIYLSGAGNSKAFVTPFAYGVKIEIDTNGDGTVETLNRYFWDNLEGPAFVSLTVAPRAPDVPEGLTQHFTATGTFSDTSTKDMTSIVTWTSSNTAIAQISSKEVTYSSCWDVGCAYAQSLGSATITATIGDVAASTTMAVSPALLVSLSVHPWSYSTDTPVIAKGMTIQYEALGTFTNNYRGDVTSSVTWSSLDNSVATISNETGSNGNARSISTGSTSISATSGGISGSSILSVSAWTFQNSGTAFDLNRVAWGGSQFVAAGANGTILTSSDGKTFQQRTSGTSASLYDVARSSSAFVAVGANGTILTSSDGTAWTPQTSGTANNLYGVVWFGSRFVAIGGNGTILTSSDGSAWTPQTSGTTNSLYGLAWYGSKLVVVGDPGTNLTSPDGITWTQQTSDNLYPLGRVAWSGSNFVATSGYPTFDGYLYPYPIHISSDGINWTKAIIVPSSTDPPSFIWRASDVVWCGTKFVVVGVDGRIFTSGDGINWTSWVSGTNNSFGAVNCSATQYVVAGKNGLIISLP